MTAGKGLLVVAVAACLWLPDEAFAASGKRHAQPASKITVHPRQRWHGYGYLPGYRPWVNNLDRKGRSAQIARAEPRYLDWRTGQWNYGWGRPGFYRGRWNGGSFGPCWVSTPIGMMPTCGQ